MKIYKTEEIKEKVESSASFSGSFPLELNITPEMQHITLDTIANILISEKYSVEDIAGIELNKISFNLIFMPKEKEKGELDMCICGHNRSWHNEEINCGLCRECKCNGFTEGE